MKRLTLVARLPPAFYIGPHAGWNYGIANKGPASSYCLPMAGTDATLNTSSTSFQHIYTTCVDDVESNDADEEFRITFCCRLRAAVHESMKLQQFHIACVK